MMEGRPAALADVPGAVDTDALVAHRPRTAQREGPTTPPITSTGAYRGRRLIEERAARYSLALRPSIAQQDGNKAGLPCNRQIC
jgi:hypothetical protein